MAVPPVLILVRHAQAQPLVETRTGANEQRPLTPVGHEQARRLAARLTTELGARPIQLWTSDYVRCRETAAPLAAAFAAGPVIDVRLREHDAGMATDLPQAERVARFPEAFKDPWGWDSRPFPDAETWREFYARCCAFLDELPADGPLPVVVAHGSSIDCLVARWLKLAPEVFEGITFAAGYASLSVVSSDRYDNRAIERLNDIAHLAGTNGWAGLGHLAG